MATGDSGAAFSNSPRSRRPFMVLDLQNVPRNCTKVTFHQQCYKLVPDLTPEDSSPASEEQSSAKTKGQLQTQTKSNLDQSSDQPKSTYTNESRRRRQLPVIPADKKPLEKLWQKSVNQSVVDPLSVKIASSHNSGQQPSTSTPIRPSSLRLTRKLSSKMLLEIETDPDNGKAFSLRLINEDDNADIELIRAKNSKQRDHKSPEIYNDCFDSFAATTASSTVKQAQDRSVSFGASASDSGMSSNMQSPTVSTNSDQTDSLDSKEQCQDQRSLKVPDATHRALYKFCARHEDEVDLEIGDAIHVFQDYDDQWSEGVNIRTGARGIFPSSLATDIEYSEFTIESSHMPQWNLFGQEGNDHSRLPMLNFRIKRERYLLNFLGSIEVGEPKGEEVLNEAISRVSVSAKPSDIGMHTPCQCILEISDIGLRMMDDCPKGRPPRTAVNTKINNVDYFFSRMQITFCGYNKLNNFAFITQHPTEKRRFACHVFQAPESTREVAEAVGRAFHRFYNHFVKVSLPLETFYLDN